MENLSTFWSFTRKNFFSILTIKGTASDVQDQSILLCNAVMFIEEAQKFNGIPYKEHEKNITTSNPITIHFSLIFPSSKNLDDYLNFMNNTL